VFTVDILRDEFGGGPRPAGAVGDPARFGRFWRMCGSQRPKMIDADDDLVEVAADVIDQPALGC
jgi:hypothetical protein